MDTCKLLTATALVAALSIPTITHASLVGRLAATEGGTDYQAYYDTEADLTWLADANAAGTIMNWSDANSWAAGFSIDGVDGWRLPDTLQPDRNCGINNVPHGYVCTESEMGNLFYNSLGNTALFLSNTGPFNNIQTYFYWSAREFENLTSDAWSFDMGTGLQHYYGKTTNFSAWAVHDGDISAAVSIVPIPASIWLFGSGLLGLIGLAKRRK